MGTLKCTVAMLALCLATVAPAHPVDRWMPFIDEASARFGVPIDWIERVMIVESGGQTSRNGRPIRSRAGAIGLMQLMPTTWAAMRDTYGLGADPDDPHDNIMAGTAYLRLMYERFGYPGLFGAYNAGPGRYARALDGQGALPSETRTYLARLVGRAFVPASTPTRLAGVLFVVRAQPPQPVTPIMPERSSLFVIFDHEK